MTTQKAFFSYEEVIDLHTESDRVSVIGIHTPTGDTPRKLCPGFFVQFKKYKYLGCKIALVPAATLPADPLQVSYEAGEPTIDPRDMLNPILWHGCHGNDLGDILNRLYAANAVTGDSSTMHLGSDAIDMVTYLNDDAMDFFGEISTNISFMESLYYRALTDRTWKKANIQRGFRVAGLRPRVYSLASTFQIMGASSLDNIGKVPSPFEIDVDVDSITPPIGSIDIGNGVSNANRFLTPRTVPLGWLDTRNVLTSRAAAEVSLDADDVGLAPSVINTMVKQGTVPVELPKIFMGVILLPPAYKTEFYFRMIVTHFFAFAGFRGCSMSNDMLENPNYHDWNEQITDAEGDDPEPEPEPDPDPEPVGPTLVMRVLGTNGFRGLVYSTGPAEFYSASIKNAYWPDSMAWEMENATAPYGKPVFNAGTYSYYWDGTNFIKKSNSSQSTATTTADVVYSQINGGCDLINFDSDTLIAMMKSDITDHMDG